MHLSTTNRIAQNALHNPREWAQLEHPGAPEIWQLRWWLDDTTEYDHERKEGRKENGRNHGIGTNGSHCLSKCAIVQLE